MTATFRERILPVLIVILAILVAWHVFVVILNAPFERDQAARANMPITFLEILPKTFVQERPVLPAPHQIVVELWDTTVNKAITSKRSLVYHAWITLSATLLGFAIGTVLGIVLAVGIVHNRAMDRSLMPWVIASQTIPILAIAPMIIVVLNAIGIAGVLPKALISTYLSFFPIVVGMVKGLRSPEQINLDLMHTYSASPAQTFWKLRWPASMPYLFTSLKVAIAISLVGAIVGELPTGAVAGLGARLLSGSYYGQTVQIWAALFMAAGLAAVLVTIVGFAHAAVLKRMGGAAVIFYLVGAVLFWIAAWAFNEWLVRQTFATPGLDRAARILVPVLFGVTILVLWEGAVRGFGIPSILLPAPSMIWTRLIHSVPTLWADFRQTFLKSVITGYVFGCGLGFLVAIAIDRSPFLQKGLMPIGNFVSALPIVGVAPIMVMWFGFDWPSKVAVVVIMTFFPMLVNTVQGLSAASSMERDLMRTYAAGWWPTLTKLRLPAAAPFIFNALKINSTLALIGAIVAEFFGTPIVGMGFRISTEVGRSNVDMVWAEIAVAAVAGSAFYGVVALVERAVTFWHPSVRGGQA